MLDGKVPLAKDEPSAMNSSGVEGGGEMKQRGRAEGGGITAEQHLQGLLGSAAAARMCRIPHGTAGNLFSTVIKTLGLSNSRRIISRNNPVVESFADVISQ